jgi:hypothetical protein
MARVVDSVVFNRPQFGAAATYKPVGRKRPKRDAIGVALGAIQIVKGVGPLIDAAAAGISGAVARGEREKAIADAKKARLAEEQAVAARAEEKLLQEQERSLIERRAKYGPGLTGPKLTVPQLQLQPPTPVWAQQGAPIGSLLTEGVSPRATPALPSVVPAVLPSVPDVQLRLPGEAAGVPAAMGATPQLQRPSALGVQPGPLGPPRIPVLPGAPPMIRAQPAPPPPGIVYPPGAPGVAGAVGAAGAGMAPRPDSTVSGRFWDAAGRYRQWLEKTQGAAIPSSEELLKMSLDEMRTLVRFGLSSDPRRRVAQLKRIGDAAAIVGRVERPSGLLGIIAGTRGGAAGRRYALELATKDKPAPTDLSIASGMAGLELKGEQIARYRKKRLKKRGVRGGGGSKSFRKLWYLSPTRDVYVSKRGRDGDEYWDSIKPKKNSPIAKSIAKNRAAGADTTANAKLAKWRKRRRELWEAAWKKTTRRQRMRASHEADKLNMPRLRVRQKGPGGPKEGAIKAATAVGAGIRAARRWIPSVPASDTPKNRAKALKLIQQFLAEQPPPLKRKPKEDQKEYENRVKGEDPAVRKARESRWKDGRKNKEAALRRAKSQIEQHRTGARTGAPTPTPTVPGKKGKKGVPAVRVYGAPPGRGGPSKR